MVSGVCMLVIQLLQTLSTISHGLQRVLQRKRESIHYQCRTIPSSGECSLRHGKIFFQISSGRNQHFKLSFGLSPIYGENDAIKCLNWRDFQCSNNRTCKVSCIKLEKYISLFGEAWLGNKHERWGFMLRPGYDPGQEMKHEGERSDQPQRASGGRSFLTREVNDDL